MKERRMGMLSESPSITTWSALSSQDSRLCFSTMTSTDSLGLSDRSPGLRRHTIPGGAGGRAVPARKHHGWYANWEKGTFYFSADAAVASIENVIEDPALRRSG